MNRVIKEILTLLNDQGFEAYIVGGYVRDLFLKKESFDIDICTNASPEKLKELFQLEPGFYGELHFEKEKYHFTITPYRKEFTYQKNKLMQFEWIHDLKVDLERRDFTINTLCLNKEGILIDRYHAQKDILNKQIKVVGNIDQKLTEDSLRILRAIRLATTLDFSLDKKLEKSLLKNKHYLKNISNYRVKEEITQILASKNFSKGIQLLKKIEAFEPLQLFFGEMTFYKEISKMWAQVKINRELPFTKEEKKNIVNERKKMKIVMNDDLEK